MRQRTNKTITKPDQNGDGFVLYGPDKWLIKNCTVDFSEYPVSQLDECLSTVNHAEADIQNSTFRGSSKGVLLGNGDYPDTDPDTEVYMTNCTIENCGRRFPEAQDGVIVTLQNCTIRNWGIKDRFDVRCFGAWAHHNAKIYAIHCKFEQTSFFQTGFLNFFKDFFNHLGQAINDRGIFGLTWKDFIPGVCRGLISTDNGFVRAVGCTKNKRWIYIENNS